MRVCPKCGEEKPDEAFRRSTRIRYGRREPYVLSYCRPCENVLGRERSKRNGTRAAAKKRNRWKRGSSSSASPGWYARLRRMGMGYGRAIEAKRKAGKPRKERGAAQFSCGDEMVGEALKAYPGAIRLDGSWKAISTHARYPMVPGHREYHIHKARAREYDRDCESDGTLTPSVVGRLFAEAKVCPYCNVEMSPRVKELDHVMPLSKGGKHSITNVVVCCRPCNRAKAARLPVNALDRRAVA